jgi:hypothetical protein
VVHTSTLASASIRRPRERPHAATALRSTPAATPIVDALLELQRTVGNAAVTELVVQRHGGTDLSSHTVTAAEQAEMPTTAESPALLAENKQLYATRAARRAAAKGAKARGETLPPEQADLTPTELARMEELDRKLKARVKGDEGETLKQNGITDTATQWFAKVTATTFLDSPIMVHELLATRLKNAERLVPKPWDHLVASTSTLREPGQSLHSFGLAIDINPGTNPQLVNPSDPHATLYEGAAQSQAIADVIDRANLLVKGKSKAEAAFWSRPTETDRTRRIDASYDKMKAASDALKEYFTLADSANKATLDGYVANLAGKDKRTAADWIKRIRLDKTQIETGPSKHWSNRKEGFLDIRKDIVQALTSDQGAGLTWLGDNLVASGRDIMHFDMRNVGPITKIVKSALGQTVGLGGD